MKKRGLSTLLMIFCCLCLLVGIGGAVHASSTLREIRAYLNYGITVKLDGVEQPLYDAKGNRVYPVSYNGTTYVPIRAISSLLGVNVDWDGSTKSVLLGDHSAVKTRLADLTYYDRKPLNNGMRYETLTTATDNLGNSYVDPVRIMWACEENYWETYVLTQDYSTFSGTLFIDYDDRDSATTCNMRVYGDGELLYDSPIMTKGVRPVDFSIDISGVDELKIEINGVWSRSNSWLAVYIGNGVLQ